jgi:hypothetical protein
MTPPPPPGGEQRGRPRTALETRATGLVQVIVRDALEAARILEAELRAGADVAVVSALLATTENLATLRGLDLGKTIAGIRARLHRIGYAV